jgi:hypothetical protein
MAQTEAAGTPGSGCLRQPVNDRLVGVCVVTMAARCRIRSAAVQTALAAFDIPADNPLGEGCP